MGLIRQTLGRVALGAAVVALGLVATAPAASADATIPVHATVNATTHLVRSGLTVSVPPGSFDGSVDLTSGAFTGNLSLPPATITLSLLGSVPLADATFELAPVGPVTGHVDLASLTVTSTATFTIHLSNVSPHGASANLVGSRCVTSKPISVTMSGVFSLSAGSTFTGSYTIPPFEHCEALTPAINALMEGPGNTFAATFTPQGGPPPTTAAPSPPPSVTPSSVGATVSGGLTLNAGSHRIAVPTNGGAVVPLPPVTPPQRSSSGVGGLVGLLLTG